MGSSENKYQHPLAASSNDLINCQINREEIQLSVDCHGNDTSTATGTRESRRTRFIYSIDTLSPAVPSTLISNANASVTTKCESCALNDEQELYDWELVDSNVIQAALNFREELKSWDNNQNKLKKKIYTIIKGYLTLRLKALNNSDMSKDIRDFFETAMKTCDPKFIVKAYTSEQKFSNLLNKDMARIVLHDINRGCSKFSCDALYATQDGTKSIASILFYYSEFTTYQGKVYRGMLVPNELPHIQVNRCIMTNTFVSTSKNLETTDRYSGYDRLEQNLDREVEDRVSIFCTYIIKNINGNRRALDISGISKYQDEDEVLLLPYSIFLITKRETIELSNQKGKRIEIELEECDEAQLISSINQE